MAKADVTAKIITTTLELAVAMPWHDISLETIATTAGLPLEEVTAQFPSKLAILDGFNLEIDNLVTAEYCDTPENDSIRDKLFDILMSRFDALHAHKPAIKSIYQKTVPFNPIAGLHGLKAVTRSMRSSLKLAGVALSSPMECLTTKALIIIYLRSFNIWLNDDTQDMGKTMASLDASLAQAEKLANILPKAT